MFPVGGEYGANSAVVGFIGENMIPADSSADKDSVRLVYDESRNIADNSGDECYVYYKIVGDRNYSIGFESGEGLRNSDGVVIDYHAFFDGASFDSAEGASGRISIGGTASGLFPVHIETESIGISADRLPAGSYHGSITLSVATE